MNEFNQSWTERKNRRGVGVRFFRPPGEDVRHRRWHVIDTHLGRRRMQWRPGIEVWHGEDGTRWAAESGVKLGWRYIALSTNQSGGLP